MRGNLECLGPGMRMNGRMEVDGDLRVEGELTGEVTCQRLIVASGGHFDGEAEVADALIEGGVSGRIVARGRVTILNGARVTADVQYRSLRIERGSLLHGRMTRL